MSVKISPFNINTVMKYGMKKVEEMEAEHVKKKVVKKDQEEEVLEEVEEVLEEVEEVQEEEVQEEVSDEELVEEAEEFDDQLPELEEEFELVEDEPDEVSSEDDGLDSLSEDELKSIAKDLGVPHWWTKGEERLIEEIREARSI